MFVSGDEPSPWRGCSSRKPEASHRLAGLASHTGAALLGLVSMMVIMMVGLMVVVMVVMVMMVVMVITIGGDGNGGDKTT